MTAEDKLQIQVAQYLRYQYPNAMWAHIPNGGSRNAIEGAKLKQMGTRAGMPDIMIFDRRGEFSGCAIELKVRPNKATAHQLKCLASLSWCGWATLVAFSFDEAKNFIDYYLTIKIQKP